MPAMLRALGGAEDAEMGEAVTEAEMEAGGGAAEPAILPRSGPRAGTVIASRGAKSPHFFRRSILPQAIGTVTCAGMGPSEATDAASLVSDETP